MPQKGVKVIAQNRKARHDYFIEETYDIETTSAPNTSMSSRSCARPKSNP